MELRHYKKEEIETGKYYIVYNTNRGDNKKYETCVPG